ncbi:MAG: DUF4258 domain-containing protein [Fervidobacterium sp.]
MVLHIELLNKNLLLTPHSFERMVERKISIDELKNLLESKNTQVTFLKNGNIKLTDGTLTAIVRWNGKEFYLVTVYRD